MYRVRRNGKQWQTKWPWKLFYPQKVDERFCRSCNLPFQNGQMPAVLDNFQSGQLDVLVFPSGGFRKKEYVLKIGRWKAGSGRFFHSEYIPMDDLPDLFRALTELERSGFWEPQIAHQTPSQQRIKG